MKAYSIYLLTIISIAILASCSKEEMDTKHDDNEYGLMSRIEMDEVIHDQMGRENLFNWQNVDTRFLWSAALQSDGLLSVGLTINGQKDISNIIHEIDMNSDEWSASKSELLSIILFHERKSRSDEALEIEDLLPPYLNNPSQPSFTFQVTSLGLVEILRAHPNVRYVESNGYRPEQEDRSDSGCSNEPDYGINPEDYSVVLPNSKIPWNYEYHFIEQAWTTSTGQGKRIVVIDTGVSSDQDNLNSNFSSGYSQDRHVSAHSTKWSGALWWASLDPPEDDCGHGTSMSGVATGPRSDDGNSVGVAYDAPLLSIRAVEDVVISTSNESNGVRDALIYAANKKYAHIISMSIGDPFYNSTVADGIYYAHNKGRLIFCAAGTSFSWTTWFGVVFPATMPETVAVTGIKEGNGLVVCESCHDGEEVDFAVVMERQNNADRHPISLAMYSDQPSYIGGSSVATSTMAGIASLVWSAHSSESRDEILDRLKNAADHFPNRDNDFGWGRVNAAQAVGNIALPTSPIFE